MNEWGYVCHDDIVVWGQFCAKVIYLVQSYRVIKKTSNKFHQGALTIIISMVIFATIADSSGSRAEKNLTLALPKKIKLNGYCACLSNTYSDPFQRHFLLRIGPGNNRRTIRRNWRNNRTDLWRLTRSKSLQ